MAGVGAVKRGRDMARDTLWQCHGGQGGLEWVEVLGRQETPGRAVQFIHDTTLPPGTSVGVHAHGSDEEYYYVLSGQGLMTVDGETFPVARGDLTAVYPGGTHGLANPSDEPLRILVVCAKSSPPYA